MKGTLKFYLRLDKQLKDGKVPIELSYSVSNQRKYYNTSCKIYQEYWDKELQKAIYIPQREAKKMLPHIDPDLLLTEREIEHINNTLDEQRKGIKFYEEEFERNKIPFSSKMVMQAYKDSLQPLTKKEQANGLLFEFIDQYIKDNAATRVKGSLSVYKALAKHLQDFEKAKYLRVTFESINYQFFQSFQNFLILKTKKLKDGSAVPQLNNTTIAKVLSTLKTFLSYARLHGIELNDSYKDFKIRKENLEVIALTQDEFDRLFQLDLATKKRLEQVRDVFCFACVTGLRYSDLKQLRKEHIKGDEIQFTVTKTKERLMVPLNYYSRYFIDKYHGQHKLLPVISSQNMNYYLKELCALAGIDDMIEIVRYRGAQRESKLYPKYELITIHTGRKTFATLSLEKGMNAEEVMAITGHKDYKSFKRYVKITEERKKVVMVKAWGN